MHKEVVLLDMDGTLTEPRGSISIDMLNCLMGIARRARVGVVSGSDFDYIMEQCGTSFIKNGVASSIDILPCNGTKLYKYSRKLNSYVKQYSVSMEEHLGAQSYKKLIIALLHCQAGILEKYNINPTGNFISYRSSTVNWSIIGRDSDKSAREHFVLTKDSKKIRNYAISLLKDNLDSAILKNIDIVLGGQTSVDIYPNGWNKTYALKHYKDRSIWFVGDKCEVGENDYHIYTELQKLNKSFATSSPNQTILILDEITDKLTKKHA